MNASLQVLVVKVQTIRTVTDIGRYATVTTLSDIVNRRSFGVCANFRERSTGREVWGKVVNMDEEIAEGRFPNVDGVIIDTWATAHTNAQPRRIMAKGGISAHMAHHRR